MRNLHRPRNKGHRQRKFANSSLHAHALHDPLEGSEWHWTNAWTRPVPALSQGFVAHLLNDCCFRKSRFFNKVALAKRPVQREVDVKNRPRAVSYNLWE